METAIANEREVYMSFALYPTFLYPHCLREHIERLSTLPWERGDYAAAERGAFYIQFDMQNFILYVEHWLLKRIKNPEDK